MYLDKSYATKKFCFMIKTITEETLKLQKEQKIILEEARTSAEHKTLYRKSLTKKGMPFSTCHFYLGI